MLFSAIGFAKLACQLACAGMSFSSRREMPIPVGIGVSYLQLKENTMPRSVGRHKNAVSPNGDTRPSTAHIAHAAHQENELIFAALRVIESRLSSPGETLTSPDKVKQYLSIRLGEQQHESFMVLFLDVKNRLIETVELFRGTLTQTSVYPREVVKEALLRNAAGVILAHNHPSGEPEPSAADRALTHALKAALALVDVRVLDHIIVAGIRQYSFAEHGVL